MKYLTSPLLFFLLSCQTNEQAVSAEIFGPDIVSSELPEFATTMNDEGTEVFFNRTTSDRSSMWIMTSRLSDGEWTKAESLPFTQGLYVDVDPFLTKDGSRLYFSSNRPVNDTVPGAFNTWYADRIGNKWSEAILAAPPLNSDSTEIFVTMADNGNAYFVSERATRGVVRSELSNGAYQPTEAIELKLNGKVHYASNPCISSDESFLIVAARPQPDTPPNLYVSFNEGGSWSELQDLGEVVNTPDFAEFAPGLSRDNKTLFFTSERPGIADPVEEGVRPPGDIYTVDLERVLKQKMKD